MILKSSGDIHWIYYYFIQNMPDAVASIIRLCFTNK